MVASEESTVAAESMVASESMVVSESMVALESMVASEGSMVAPEPNKVNIRRLGLSQRQLHAALGIVSVTCQKEERKEKTTAFGINLMQSRVSYWAAQTCGLSHWSFIHVKCMLGMMQKSCVTGSIAHQDMYEQLGNTDSASQAI